MENTPVDFLSDHVFPVSTIAKKRAAIFFRIGGANELLRDNDSDLQIAAGPKVNSCQSPPKNMHVLSCFWMVWVCFLVVPLGLLALNSSAMAPGKSAQLRWGEFGGSQYADHRDAPWDGGCHVTPCNSMWIQFKQWFQYYLNKTNKTKCGSFYDFMVNF